MLEIGSLVGGKYKILNVVGRGGMSVVYLAMNERANKQWAVKEVTREGVTDCQRVRQRLAVETDMLKRLSHPNLPSIVDVIEEEETLLIVMDYIQGNPLSRVVEESGAQPQESVVSWARQLCDVLGYLHTRRPPIIYRDLKPANIMLGPEGKVTLIDFGTAREFKETGLGDTAWLGTPGYAAPEQFGGLGQTDERTDIYCLGATLYHLVTGENPSQSRREMRPLREINPGLSGGLEKIIQKCTRLDPRERYQSAAELMYDLEHYREMEDRYRMRQKRRLAVFLGALTLTVLAWGVSLWGHMGVLRRLQEDYVYRLRLCADPESCLDTVLIRPGRREAYLKLAELLTEDFRLTYEEMGILRGLQAGLEERDARGYLRQTDVLARLSEEDPEGYGEVCLRFGEACLFYYDVALERDRYLAASEWFGRVRDRYPAAGIYCDMAELLERLYQYGNARVKQTAKLYEAYGELWERVEALQRETERSGDLDCRLQVWSLTVRMLADYGGEFVEVAGEARLEHVLDGIQDGMAGVEERVLAPDLEALGERLEDVREKLRWAGGLEAQ